MYRKLFVLFTIAFLWHSVINNSADGGTDWLVMETAHQRPHLVREPLRSATNGYRHQSAALESAWQEVIARESPLIAAEILLISSAVSLFSDER